MAEKTVLEAEVKSNIGEVADGIGKAADNTEKLQKETKKASGSFGGLGTAVKGVGSALKAAGIGLIVGLFVKLGDVFRQNQKVLDGFNTAMEFLSITFNDFFKFIGSNIDTTTEFFDKIFGSGATQKVAEFGKTLALEVTTRIKNLIEGIGGLGKALFKVFKGDFKEASEAASEAVTNLTEVIVGNEEETKKVEETFSKITNKIKEYTKATFEQAKSMVSLRNESELAAVKVQGLIEEYDRQAEKLRQVRDDESKTFEERIEANNKLGEVLKEQEEEMLKLVDIQIAAAQADVDKNNNLENQIKLQEALNEKKAVQAQITGFESEQLVNNISLNKEQKQVALDNAQAQLEAFSGLAGALSALAGENKELAVAGAIIDTYAGASKALAAGAGTPLGFINAAAIIAAGLANVQKILSPPIPNGGGGGGSIPSGGGSAPQTPAPQMMSGAFDLTGGVAPEPVRAFVVTDEMTSSQNQLANIRRRATI